MLQSAARRLQRGPPEPIALIETRVSKAKSKRSDAVLRRALELGGLGSGARMRQDRRPPRA